MYMKRALLFLALGLNAAFLCAQNTPRSTTDVILSSFSARNYTTDQVSDKDIRTILECGIKAPSAMNKQPWKFTVIKDSTLVMDVMRNAVPGNVLIIISGTETATPGSTVDFDCGLAAENMYVAAQGLGLGSRIYMTGVNIVNGKKDVYGIPEGFKAISILRVGNVPKTPDANSSASARKSFEEIVIYK